MYGSCKAHGFGILLHEACTYLICVLKGIKNLPYAFVMHKVRDDGHVRMYIRMYTCRMHVICKVTACIRDTSNMHTINAFINLLYCVCI